MVRFHSLAQYLLLYMFNDKLFTKNFVSYVLKHNGIIKTLSTDLNKEYNCFNPSCFIKNDNIYVLLRCNEILYVNGKYIPSKPNWLTVNQFPLLCIYNKNDLSLKETHIINSNIISTRTLEKYLEDYRIIDIVGNNLIIIGTSGACPNTVSIAYINLYTYTLTNKYNVSQYNFDQKNYVPVYDDKKYTIISNINNTERFIWNEKISDKTYTKNNLQDYRGSTPYIKYNDKYYGIIHKRKGNTYYHWFICLNSDLSFNSISNVFKFNKLFNTEMTLGLYLDNNDIYITFSESDNLSFILKFNIDLLFNDCEETKYTENMYTDFFVNYNKDKLYNYCKDNNYVFNYKLLEKI